MSKHALPLLLEDDQIIAVDKPAGLPVIPGREVGECVRHLLEEQMGQKVRPVHRLDRDTSGVLLFARTLEAQRHLSHQFQNNTVQKVYNALVAGRPAADEGTIDAMLKVDERDKTRMTVAKRHGKVALTTWTVLERYRSFALVEAKPKTGKMHQIRVHLQHAGMPLAVDPLYNPDGRVMLSDFKRGYRPGHSEERPLIGRLTLHALRLSFAHPNGLIMTLQSEWPKDFRQSVQQLRKSGS